MRPVINSRQQEPPGFLKARSDHVYLRYTPLVLAVYLFLTFGPAIGLASNAPNIVLIIADDQSWNSTSVPMDPDIPHSGSDYHQTPNIQSLANEGMRFSKAYVSPLCRPSQMALQTGKSPAQLQITDNGQDTQFSLMAPRPADTPRHEVSIGQRILEANPNYQTGHFGKYAASVAGWGHVDKTIVDRRYSEIPEEQDPKTMFTFAASANEFIETSVNENKPFYIQFTHNGVKSPTRSLPETFNKYEGLTKGIRHQSSSYAAMTEDLDTTVGMALDKLRQLNIADNTYVIYTSDNGGAGGSNTPDQAWNYPLSGKKGSLQEGGIRVPLIIKGPGIQPNTVSDVPTIVMDLFPTISELAGASYPLHEGIEGTSLVPVLMNGGQLPQQTQTLKRQYAENGELFFHSTEGIFPHSAIIDGDYKLVKKYGMSIGTLLTSTDPNATATWTPKLKMGGGYEIYTWLGAKDGSDELELDSEAIYTIEHADGQSLVTIDQNAASGQWNLLGTFDLNPHESHGVTLAVSNATPDGSIADAVRFVPVSGRAMPITIERQDAEFSRTGEWRVAMGLDTYSNLGRRYTLRLLDLSNDLSEATDLASQFPELTAELEEKLNKWQRDADASLMYDISVKTQLVWDGEFPGQQSDVELAILEASMGTTRPQSDFNSDGIVDELDRKIKLNDVSATWRSTVDVEYKNRETWYQLDNSKDIDRQPQHVMIHPHQPFLPTKAFQFDGDDGMERVHFSVPYSDHSATFEFWLRLDSLNQEHMLFETGHTAQGLSVTIGDADSDGEFDDIHFRAKAPGSSVITATSELDRFTDPTHDFVQVVAVISNDLNDRYAEIYINGSLFERTEGLANINWDHTNKAGLGLAGGSKVGGDSGIGELPFTASGFNGDLAFMRYYNQAIDAHEVLNNYNLMLAHVDAGIVSTSGDVVSPTERPSDVRPGAHTGDQVISVLQERTDQLNDALPVDISPYSSQTYGKGGLTTGFDGTLDAGILLTSYLLHFDPQSDPNTTQTTLGSVTFDRPIRGIIFTDESLQKTDPLLGTIGQYPIANRNADLENDTLALSDDLRTLTLTLNATAQEIIELRVLTSAILGDANSDGMVDIMDLAILGANINTDMAILGANINIDDRLWMHGDFNFDGVVDVEDLAILGTHWTNLNELSLTGAWTDSGSDNLLPEPSSSALMIALLFSAIRPTRNRHS